MAPLIERNLSRACVAGLTAVTLFAWVSAGRAAVPAAPVPVVDGTAAAKHAAPKPALPQSGPPPCADGEPRDDSGACPVVDDTPATRGFELFSGALPPPGTRPAPATAVADTAPPTASDRTGCGAICDLKISFRSGSSALPRQAEARLVKFAQMLASPSLAGTRFEIAGHTDSSGLPARNLALSQARAETVTAFLVAHGVSATRLSAKGYGADRLLLQKLPLDPRNRRVEARVLE